MIILELRWEVKNPLAHAWMFFDFVLLCLHYFILEGNLADTDRVNFYVLPATPELRSLSAQDQLLILPDDRLSNLLNNAILVGYSE
jgi:hypothetical protein